MKRPYRLERFANNEWQKVKWFSSEDYATANADSNTRFPCRVIYQGNIIFLNKLAKKQVTDAIKTT